MTAVECGIKAFDVHELLCHFVAKRLGYYADEGLEVRLVDVTFTPDEWLPARSYFQVACGAAYLGRREGHPFKVLLAAVDWPMFWLFGRPGIERVEDLVGKRVATYPPIAPPHSFSRVALRNHGLDPDRDLSFWPCRDDIIRLGLLREGDVDAAVISSARSPVSVHRQGFTPLAFLGEEVRFVTTGVATTEEIVRGQPDLVAALVRAFRRSLETIHGAPGHAVAVVADLLGVPEEVAAATFDLFRPCYTEDGRVPDDVLESAVARLNAELTTGDDVRAEDLYDFSLITDWDDAPRRRRGSTAS